MTKTSRMAVCMNEAASLRRMVRGSRLYGGSLQIGDEAGALDKARRAVEFSRYLRERA